MLTEQGTDDAIPVETLSAGDRFYNEYAEQWQRVRELRRPFGDVLLNGRWLYAPGTLVKVRRASGDGAR
ncbi:MAG: hypothetical protein ACTHOE_09930 [Conexibacter sp.]